MFKSVKRLLGAGDPPPDPPAAPNPMDRAVPGLTFVQVSTRLPTHPDAPEPTDLLQLACSPEEERHMRGLRNAAYAARHPNGEMPYVDDVMAGDANGGTLRFPIDPAHMPNRCYYTPNPHYPRTDIMLLTYFQIVVSDRVKAALDDFRDPDLQLLPLEMTDPDGSNPAQYWIVHFLTKTDAVAKQASGYRQVERTIPGLKDPLTVWKAPSPLPRTDNAVFLNAAEVETRALFRDARVPGYLLHTRIADALDLAQTHDLIRTPAIRLEEGEE